MAPCTLDDIFVGRPNGSHHWGVCRQRTLDLLASGQDGLNVLTLVSELELLDCLRRLPLVQDHRFLDIQAVHVQRYLSDMRGQRHTDLVPQLVQCDLALAERHEQLRGVELQGSDTHCLDLQNRSSLVIVDDAVSVSNEMKILAGNVDLLVAEVGVKAFPTDFR